MFFGSDYCESINKSHVGWLSQSNHNFSPVTLKSHGWWSFISFPPWKTAMTTAIQLQGFLWWNPHRSSLTLIKKPWIESSQCLNSTLIITFLHFGRGHHRFFLWPEVSGGVLPRAAGVRSSRDGGAATAAALPSSEAVGPRSGRGGPGWRGGAGSRNAVENVENGGKTVEVEMGEILYKELSLLFFFNSWWMGFVHLTYLYVPWPKLGFTQWK